MPPKKGMSLEQKRETMMSIFHSTCEVFNLKELESKGAKAGVNQMTIKDIVESLVDDKLIEQDKIGSGNFYWSFPAAAYVSVKTKVDSLEEAIESERTAIAGLKRTIEQYEATQTSTIDRGALMAEIESLKAQNAALDKQIQAQAANDPEVIVQLEKKLKIAKEGSDRWTDNVWAMKSYMVKKFGKDPKEVNAMLSITGAFDYIEVRRPGRRTEKIMHEQSLLMVERISGRVVRRSVTSASTGHSTKNKTN